MAGCALRELPTGNYQLLMANSWQFAPPIGSKDEHLCSVCTFTHQHVANERVDLGVLGGMAISYLSEWGEGWWVGGGERATEG